MRRRVDGPGLSADELRDRRLDAVRRLAERFLLDLGRLLAGLPAHLEDYLSATAASRLRSSLQPFLSSGDVLRPNFGEYGELRVKGDLLGELGFAAHIEFDDQSVRETSSGELLTGPRRRMHLRLDIDPDGRTVRDYTLRRLPAP